MRDLRHIYGDHLRPDEIVRFQRNVFVIGGTSTRLRFRIRTGDHYVQASEP